MTNQEPTTQKDPLSVNKQEFSATLASKDSKNKTEQEAPIPSASSTMMNEDNEDGGIQISDEEFIKAVIQNIPEGASPAICSKPGDPQEGGWKAKPSDCAIIAPERIIHDFVCFLFTYRTSAYLQKDSRINRS